MSAAGTNAAPRELGYLEAIHEAQLLEMQRDPRVVLVAEDIGLMQKEGPYAALGPNRLWSAPISENGFVGMAVGAAMTGLRPIVDLMISSLVYVAMDALVSQAAKSAGLFGWQTRVPLVVRAAMWYGQSYAAHHSDRPYPMFANVPGLKIALPATPADAKGLLLAAIRDDDPVLVFEDRNLWGARGPVPEGDAPVPLGRAAIRREGGDVTIVALAGCVPLALEAADALAAEGIAAEVLDPRTLVPFDRDALVRSVAKTGRLVVADPAHRTGSAAAEIAAIAAEEAFAHLRAPVRRVCTPDVQVPFSPPLEAQLYPTAERIAGAAREVVGAPAPGAQRR
ncbi:MAG: transketolase C-terminal domain-containing protein [Myxococcota bacterium]|nr:alpha-ketoacid dehydrogenase subunit beta [Myxococcales bacterium]